MCFEEHVISMSFGVRFGSWEGVSCGRHDICSSMGVESEHGEQAWKSAGCQETGKGNRCDSFKYHRLLRMKT